MHAQYGVRRRQLRQSISRKVLCPWQLRQSATRSVRLLSPPRSSLTMWSTSKEAGSSCPHCPAHIHDWLAATNRFRYPLTERQCRLSPTGAPPTRSHERWGCQRLLVMCCCSLASLLLPARGKGAATAVTTCCCRGDVGSSGLVCCCAAALLLCCAPFGGGVVVSRNRNRAKIPKSASLLQLLLLRVVVASTTWSHGSFATCSRGCSAIAARNLAPKS